MRVRVRLAAAAAVPFAALASMALAQPSAHGAVAANAGTVHAQTTQPIGPGAAIDMAQAETKFRRLCSKCHVPDLATSEHHDRAGWKEVIQRMSGFGLVASEAEVQEVVEYLAANYPPAQ